MVEAIDSETPTGDVVTVIRLITFNPRPNPTVRWQCSVHTERVGEGVKGDPPLLRDWVVRPGTYIGYFADDAGNLVCPKCVKAGILAGELDIANVDEFRNPPAPFKRPEPEVKYDGPTLWQYSFQSVKPGPGGRAQTIRQGGFQTKWQAETALADARCKDAGVSSVAKIPGVETEPPDVATVRDALDMWGSEALALLERALTAAERAGRLGELARRIIDAADIRDESKALESSGSGPESSRNAGAPETPAGPCQQAPASGVPR